MPCIKWQLLLPRATMPLFSFLKLTPKDHLGITYGITQQLYILRACYVLRMILATKEIAINKRKENPGRLTLHYHRLYSPSVSNASSFSSKVIKWTNFAVCTNQVILSAWKGWTREVFIHQNFQWGGPRNLGLCSGRLLRTSSFNIQWGLLHRHISLSPPIWSKSPQLSKKFNKF